MRYPVTLWTAQNTNCVTELFIVDPNNRKGHVATVYDNPAAAQLMAHAPDLKYALEAILRVHIDPLDGIRTIDDMFEEIRAIATEAVEIFEDDDATD